MHANSYPASIDFDSPSARQGCPKMEGWRILYDSE